MEIQGKIIKIGKVETFGSKGFKKAELWLEVKDGEYPQTLNLEVVKDKADEIQSLQVGTEIKAYINLRGRKWMGVDGVEKVFNSITLWKYEAVDVAF
tara:strand:+ start:27 stop:317 length:291 start_codon:yes stop_codon:yes gene_type:complete